MDNSQNSSFKSRDSTKSKQNSIKIRVEKFNEERKKYNGEKDEEYAVRRQRKKERKLQIQRDKKLKRYKCLYWPSAIAMSCGCVFIFGATIRSLSEGSVLWDNRETFRIVGPVLLGGGFVLFLVTVAFVTNHTNKLRDIKEKEAVKRKEDRRQRIQDHYQRLKNSNWKCPNRQPVQRTISATSSATCYSIDELESSDQFLLGTFTDAAKEKTFNGKLVNGHSLDAKSGSLHPNWKPLIKKDSTESNSSSKLLLECSLSSSSTLMTSLSSTNTSSLVSPNIIREVDTIDEVSTNSNDINLQIPIKV